MISDDREAESVSHATPVEHAAAPVHVPSYEPTPVRSEPAPARQASTYVPHPAFVDEPEAEAIPAPRDSPRSETPPPAAEPAATPPATRSFGAPLGGYQPLVQHEDTESHRPVRKRQSEGQGAPDEPLQLVETAAAVVMAPVEDELPRRTKPRRRPTAVTTQEALQLVETAPGTEAPAAKSTGD
jgi:hypothetical protein